jgi:hemerythrin superfamily protein
MYLVATAHACASTPKALALHRVRLMGILSKVFNRENAIDVLELLETQHKEVDALFEQIEKGNGNRRALFTELADKLAAHATVEEKIFYPAVMAKDTNELLQESVEEHLAIKRILADLITMDLDDDGFAAKLQVLKEQVTHHAHKEEEKKLFPKVKDLMTEDERLGLGNEVLAMFEELMMAHPYKNVPSETAEAAPLPPLK